MYYIWFGFCINILYIEYWTGTTGHSFAIDMKLIFMTWYVELFNFARKSYDAYFLKKTIFLFCF